MRMSTCGMIAFSSLRPSSVSTLRVTDSLFRASDRNRAPHFSPSLEVNMYSSRPKGVSLPERVTAGGSTMMTSAPSSEKCESTSDR